MFVSVADEMSSPACFSAIVRDRLRQRANSDVSSTVSQHEIVSPNRSFHTWSDFGAVAKRGENAVTWEAEIYRVFKDAYQT